MSAARSGAQQRCTRPGHTAEDIFTRAKRTNARRAVLARHVATREPKKPKQASLRRAISEPSYG
jgi:hypothetical protein